MCIPNLINLALTLLRYPYRTPNHTFVDLLFDHLAASRRGIHFFFSSKKRMSTVVMLHRSQTKCTRYDTFPLTKNLINLLQLFNDYIIEQGKGKTHSIVAKKKIVRAVLHICILLRRWSKGISLAGLTRTSSW